MRHVSSLRTVMSLLGFLAVWGLCSTLYSQSAAKPAAANGTKLADKTSASSETKEEGSAQGEKKEPTQSASLFEAYRLAFAKEKLKGVKTSANNAEAATEPTSYFGLATLLQEEDLSSMKMEYIKRRLPAVTIGGGGTFQRHVDAITAIHPYPDNEHVLTSSADKTAQIWKLSDQKPVRLFQDEFNHKEGITDIATSPNGNYVLTASFDGSIRLWNAKNGKNTKAFMGLRDRVWAVAVSPRGNLVAGASDEGKVMFWDPSTMKRLGSFEGHAGAVYDLNFSNDGRYLITACNDGVARIWDMVTLKEVQALSGHQDKIYSAVFSPDNSMVLTASRDKTARLWSTYQGMELCRFVGHVGAVRSALFLVPPTPTAATGGAAKQATTPDSPGGAKNSKFLVVSGGDDGTIRVWYPVLQKPAAKKGAAGGAETNAGGPGAGDLGAGAGAGAGGAGEKIFSNPADEREEEELDENGKPKKKRVTSTRPAGKSKGIEIGQTKITGAGGQVGVYAMALTYNGRLLAGGSDGIVRIMNFSVEIPGAKKKKK
ncbi:MAG: hypothetical protein PHQ75_08210 [Thermoguttaceae bacterium]|nr:hypothetical protein [Thermoguttaceae bacterium]